VNLRQQWTDHPEQENADLELQARNTSHVQEMMDDTLEQRLTMVTASSKAKGPCSRFIAQPGANWRLAWDLSGAILIGYDTVAIPFDLSFQPTRGTFLTTMDWVTMLFWTFDMVFTFFVGYMHRGQVVMSPSRIAQRYLMTWFTLDALVVAGDWFNNVGKASTGSGSVSGFARLVRSLRAIRVLRLLRLLKLRRMMAELQDQISSEYTYLLLNLLKLLFFILFLNHGIACVWYWLGRSMMADGQPSWVSKNEMMGRDIGYKYTTSMHWTLTQFTPASMEVFPQNTWERTMSVIVLMFALVAFSSFVGSISTSMTALRNMNADTAKQFWMLRRYLKQQGIPKKISRRILKYLEYIVERKQGKVQHQSIKILGLLSEQLREELLCELTRPHLQGYQLFKYMNYFPHMEVTFRRLCTFAFKNSLIATGDVLFYTGDEATHTYCVINGHVIYHIEGRDLFPPVQEMEWLSEAAIWVPWKHMGRLSAMAETELLAADVKIFTTECCKSVATWRVTSSFAKIFLEAYNFCENAPTDVIRDDSFRTTLENQCNAGRGSVMTLCVEHGGVEPGTPRAKEEAEKSSGLRGRVQSAVNTRMLSRNSKRET